MLPFFAIQYLPMVLKRRVYKGYYKRHGYTPFVNKIRRHQLKNPSQAWVLDHIAAELVSRQCGNAAWPFASALLQQKSPLNHASFRAVANALAASFDPENTLPDDIAKQFVQLTNQHLQYFDCRQQFKTPIIGYQHPIRFKPLKKPVVEVFVASLIHAQQEKLLSAYLECLHAHTRSTSLLVDHMQTIIDCTTAIKPLLGNTLQRRFIENKFNAKSASEAVKACLLKLSQPATNSEQSDYALVVENITNQGRSILKQDYFAWLSNIVVAFLSDQLENNHHSDVLRQYIEPLYGAHIDQLYATLYRFFIELNVDQAATYAKRSLSIRDNNAFRGEVLKTLYQKSYYIKCLDFIPSPPRTMRQRKIFQRGHALKTLLENGPPIPLHTHPISDTLPQEKFGLYLMYCSLPYHSNGYATRSQGLLEITNQHTDYALEAVTRLGYPEDFFKTLPSKYPSQTAVNGVIYHRLPSSLKTTRLRTTLNQYLENNGEAVYQFALTKKPAFIHAASNYVNAVSAVWAAKKLGVPSIYEVRGLWEVTRASKDKAWAKSDERRYLSAMEAVSAQNADYVITITHALKDEMIRRGVSADKITVLPNGVDSKRFKPLAKDTALAKSLQVENDVVIGYVGSLVEYEGLDTLLEACVALKSVPNWKLLIVGDGDSRKTLTEKSKTLGLSPRVIFTGRVPHDAVEKYYSLIDIAPFPRKPMPVCEMVSPLKPFEAMSMQKAVVASDVAALKEIVDHRQNGLLFDKHSVDSLSRALKLLIEDETLRNTLAKNARDWVSTERDWRVLASQLEAFYDRILANPQKSFDPARIVQEKARVAEAV